MANGERWRTVGDRARRRSGLRPRSSASPSWGSPRPAAALLGLPIPDDPVYLYSERCFPPAAGGCSTRRRHASRSGIAPIAPISAGDATLGFVLFVVGVGGRTPSSFLGLGLADLGLAVATFAAWRRAVALSD